MNNVNVNFVSKLQIREKYLYYTHKYIINIPNDNNQIGRSSNYSSIQIHVLEMFENAR